MLAKADKNTPLVFSVRGVLVFQYLYRIYVCIER